MIFSLDVDDFGVQYVENQLTEHLITCIQKYSPVSVDCTRKLYCGVILDWEYKHKYVTLSIPGYVEGGIHEYHQNIPTCPHLAPQKMGGTRLWVKSSVGINDSDKPILTTGDRKYI